MLQLAVRDLPPTERHATIIDRFEGMDRGETLRLINDHDPKPLFDEMRAEVETFVAEFPKHG